MKPIRVLSLIAVLGAMSLVSKPAEAANRAYYSAWRYYPQRTYYYVHYYYKPVASYTSYSHHYCIYYPSRPRYVYYYNPVRRVFWGRYDVEAKGYSLLAENDRKGSLGEIPESAFPAPGEMPVIPESEDGQRMDPPPATPKS